MWRPAVGFAFLRSPPARHSRWCTSRTTATSVPRCSTTCSPSPGEVSSLNTTSAAVSGGIASMVVRRILACAFTAPLLLVSACSGGNTSVADPPVSPRPSSSSPTGSPHRESPEHFIRRWAAEDATMQNSGNTSTFRSLAIGCSGCEAVADRIDDIYGAGGNVQTHGWSIVRAYQSARHGKSRTVELIVDSAPTRYRPSSEASTKYLEGGREHFQVVIAPRSWSWVVSRFVQVDS
jgi:hypothetical protein